MGLSYYDSSTGSNVLFAELQDSTGMLVRSNRAVDSNLRSPAAPEWTCRYTHLATTRRQLSRTW